jgi:hypothetical protein
MSNRHPNEPTGDRPVQRPVVGEEVPGLTAAALEPSFRDRVRWGPIIAGVFTALVTLLVMTVLGLALGLTAFEPDETGDRTVTTAAAIWGILTAVLAFFLGGWMAGRNATGTPHENGAVNGFLVGAATIVVMLWMIGSGLGNLMGLAGTNLDEITQIVFDDPLTEVSGEEITDVVPTENYDAARDSAWGTLAGLVVALAAAAAGGAMGHPDRATVMTGVPSRRRAPQAR